MEFSACFLFILGFEDWSCTYGLFYEIEAMGDVFCWFINWPEETSCPSHRFGQNGFLDCQGFEIAHWSVLSGMMSSISSLYACFLLFFLINLIKEIANSDSLDSLSCVCSNTFTPNYQDCFLLTKLNDHPWKYCYWAVSLTSVLVFKVIQNASPLLLCEI